MQKTSADRDGGVLYVRAGTLTFMDNTFQKNSADHDGEVLSLLTGNTFQKNSANLGVSYTWLDAV